MIHRSKTASAGAGDSDSSETLALERVESRNRVEGDLEGQATDRTRRLQGQTSRSRGWFGGDKSQSIAFYGEFYR